MQGVIVSLLSSTKNHTSFALAVLVSGQCCKKLVAIFWLLSSRGALGLSILISHAYRIHLAKPYAVTTVHVLGKCRLVAELA